VASVTALDCLPLHLLPCAHTRALINMVSHVCVRACAGNWFFNNWAPPHMDLAEYGKWATAVLAALHSGGATDTQLRAVFRENSLRAYRVH
jgi:hypothetical protein